MSTWTGEIRRREAEQRREGRAARKKQKDLERAFKERLKLSELEQARLEVDAFENSLEILVTLHKDQSPPVEWERFATAPAPHTSCNAKQHEFNALLRNGVEELHGVPASTEASLHAARELDHLNARKRLEDHARWSTEWSRMAAFAKRVLSGDPVAYAEAFAEFSPLDDVAGLIPSLRFTAHGPKLLDCKISVNGRGIVPEEVKTLTTSGKLSVKAMPKSRFNGIFQDYVCSAVYGQRGK